MSAAIGNWSSTILGPHLPPRSEIKPQHAPSHFSVFFCSFCFVFSGTYSCRNKKISRKLVGYLLSLICGQPSFNTVIHCFRSQWLWEVSPHGWFLIKLLPPYRKKTKRSINMQRFGSVLQSSVQIVFLLITILLFSS